MTEDEFRSKKVEPAFDYMAEADKTCSIVFRPDYVNRDDFVRTLQSIAQMADVLNLSKKLLFRGKTPDELSLLTPSLADSLHVEFDRNNSSDDDINLLHGIVGVITEAGEMAEVLLHRITAGEFDKTNAFEEIGDVSWYLARQLRGLNTTFDVSNRANIDKLHGRHGSAFDVFRDANRDLSAERSRLEDATAPLFEASDKDASRGDNHFAAGNEASERSGVEPASNVGTPASKRRSEPPGVERHLRTPLGDCEGMDC